MTSEKPLISPLHQRELDGEDLQDFNNDEESFISYQSRVDSRQIVFRSDEVVSPPGALDKKEDEGAMKSSVPALVQNLHRLSLVEELKQQGCQREDQSSSGNQLNDLSSRISDSYEFCTRPAQLQQIRITPLVVVVDSLSESSSYDIFASRSSQSHPNSHIS